MENFLIGFAIGLFACGGFLVVMIVLALNANEKDEDDDNH